MGTIKGDWFAAMKARVKAETLRRCHSGSVASYGGSAYDYTAAPGAGKTLRNEHVDKLTGPLSAINSDVIPATSGTRTIRQSELANIETRMAVLEARSMTDRSGSDCKSGCTGTCYTGCATGCSGCGSGCPTSCSGCGSGCPTGCSTCGGACSSGCGDVCTGCSGCGSGCEGGCRGGCGRSCADDCTGNCSGCESTCAWDCRWQSG